MSRIMGEYMSGLFSLLGDATGSVGVLDPIDRWLGLRMGFELENGGGVEMLMHSPTLLELVFELNENHFGNV